VTALSAQATEEGFRPWQSADKCRRAFGNLRPDLRRDAEHPLGDRPGTITRHPVNRFFFLERAPRMQASRRAAKIKRVSRAAAARHRFTDLNKSELPAWIISCRAAIASQLSGKSSGIPARSDCLHQRNAAAIFMASRRTLSGLQTTAGKTDSRRSCADLALRRGLRHWSVTPWHELANGFSRRQSQSNANPALRRPTRHQAPPLVFLGATGDLVHFGIPALTPTAIARRFLTRSSPTSVHHIKRILDEAAARFAISSRSTCLLNPRHSDGSRP